ncbi:MAG: PDZ domain-containing protein [Ruminococcaceae bacterium]|nr:PDZ domain-containing protein [Oscillospiraceae bacterium]
MNEHNEHSYENGSTRPPKNHGGVIAAVLCICIVLLGVASAVGILSRLSGDPYTESGNVLFSEIGSTGTSSSPASSSVQTVPDPDNQMEIALNSIPAQVDNVPQTGGMGLQDIYDKNIPSVVSITCTLSGGTSTGTGVVLSENGYLVTNAHVVDGAREIEVLLSDERTFSATLVGSDSLSDLAVLYVDAKDLIPAEFGDSAQVRVGDAVVAIGDPLGVEFRGTMTDGIVSAINRNVQTGGRTMTLIQTNAALNSGNSGGPLINCFGQVIGINTLKIGTFTDDAGVEGLGFAIPSAMVKQIVDQLIAQGYVSGRPTLELEGQWVSSFHQQFRGIPAGLYITGAPAGSGIRAKDILLSIDGTRVTTQEALDGVLYSHQAGDRVTLVLYRDGRQFTVELTLQEAGK